MSKFLKCIFAAMLFSFASMANAILINFADIANGNLGTSQYDWTNVSGGEAGYDSIVFRFDMNFGPDLVLTITGNDETGSAFAYLDSTSGGRIGGLGVCPLLTNSMQCNPSSDDNVRADEMLTFTFTIAGVEVDIEDFTMTVNNNHGGGITEGHSLSLSDGVWDLNNTDLGFTTQSHLFGTDNEYTAAYNNGEFYIETIEFTLPERNPPQQVPEPANLVLMTLALFGLIVARRRAKS